jgi:7-cyano-7-deazaguanine synthase in queuosine biosynthesis
MQVLRYVGKDKRTSKRYTELLGANATGVVDTMTGDRNVTVGFRLNGDLVQVDMARHMRDFLDLAATVYIADEFIARAEAADGWNRDIAVAFPAYKPSLWQGVESVLAEMLRSLSGDRFTFEWLKREDLPNYGRHRVKLQGEYDCACLFSGGIDSLLGAFDLLSARKKVLLVGHHADTVTSTAQNSIFDILQKQFPGKVDFVQALVARSKNPTHRFQLPPKVEVTHRPRSFLFIALAAAAASSLGIRQLVVPENGLIALNAPLQISRLGTHSTRTAHPRFLGMLLDVLHQIDTAGWQLTNPFLYQSKTDMLKALDPGLKALVRKTVSCAHAADLWRSGATGLRHCGYCVPCIYRRAALYAAGLDLAKDYAKDVFSSLGSLTTYTQADFRALVSFARRMAAATPAARQLAVVSNGHFSPTLGAILGPRPANDYTPWAEMIRRWAEDFLAAVDAKSSAKTKQILGLKLSKKVQQ